MELLEVIKAWLRFSRARTEVRAHEESGFVGTWDRGFVHRARSMLM